MKVTGTPGVKTFDGLALTDTVGVTAGDTFTTKGFEVCCAGRAHCAFEVSLAVTTSPSDQFVAENVGVFVPTGVVFRYHWYCGAVPPPAMFATKLRVVPAHTVGAVPKSVLMLMPVSTGGNTVIVIGAAAAVAGSGQVALDAIVSVITSPFTGVMTVNVGLFRPTCTELLRVHVNCGNVPPPVVVAVKVTGTPAHTLDEPVDDVMETAVGVEGVTLTGYETVGEEPQTFCAVTVMFPLPPTLEDVAVRTLPVEEPAHPAGTVHV